MKNSSFSGRCGQLLKGAGLCLATIGLVGLICVPALETLAEPQVSNDLGPLSLSKGKVQQQRVEALLAQEFMKRADECPCNKRAKMQGIAYLKILGLKQTCPTYGQQVYYDAYIEYCRKAIEVAAAYGSLYPHYGMAYYYYWLSHAYNALYAYTCLTYYGDLSVYCGDQFRYWQPLGLYEMYYGLAQYTYDYYSNINTYLALTMYYYYVSRAMYNYYLFTNDSYYYDLAMILNDAYLYWNALWEDWLEWN